MIFPYCLLCFPTKTQSLALSLCAAKIGNYAGGEAEEGDAEACSFEFGDL